MPHLFDDIALITPDADYVNNSRLRLILDYIGPQPGLLSAYFQPGMAEVLQGGWNLHVDFTPGRLRVLRLGSQAFESYQRLLLTIRHGLGLPTPTTAAPGATPSILSQAGVNSALSYNRARRLQPNTIKIIQGVVGAAPDGRLGKDTVQWIATWQTARGLTGDGQLGRLTIRQLFYRLRSQQQYDAMLQLIIDYFNFPGRNVITAYYAPDVTEVLAEAPLFQTMPAVVRVGPTALKDAEFAAAVAAVGHEFEHARLAQMRSLQSLSVNERMALHEFMAHSWGLAQARRIRLSIERVVEEVAFAAMHWESIPRFVRRQPFVVARHEEAARGLQSYITRLRPGDVELGDAPLTDPGDIRDMKNLLRSEHRRYVNLRR
jgi:hypothetical protein